MNTRGSKRKPRPKGRAAKRERFVSEMCAGLAKQLSESLVGHDLRPGTRVQISFQIQTPDPRGERPTLRALLDTFNRAATAVPVTTITL